MSTHNHHQSPPTASLSIRSSAVVILTKRNRERDTWKESPISISHINFVGATAANGGEWRGIRESLRWNGSIVQQGSIYCACRRGSFTDQGIFFLRLTSAAVGFLDPLQFFTSFAFYSWSAQYRNRRQSKSSSSGWMRSIVLELAPEHMFIALPRWNLVLIPVNDRHGEYLSSMIELLVYSSLWVR